jgi:hypothetical protein
VAKSAEPKTPHAGTALVTILMIVSMGGGRNTHIIHNQLVRNLLHVLVLNRYVSLTSVAINNLKFGDRDYMYLRPHLFVISRVLNLLIFRRIRRYTD